MEKSAAAMAAMGQSFEDTIALFTGGMEILQDADSMGTALRSMSMRIRGYDEETQQLSADLVDVSGKVADLTKTASTPHGISLFTDASQEHYKSMVQYLGEISDIWSEISEKNQTDLLQQLFGKTRANAGAAILTNFDAVRKSLEVMEQSAGSADKEMSTIESSLSYKLNNLQQIWVGTAQTIVDRGNLGGAIDGLSMLSNALGFVIEKVSFLVDKLGLLQTALVGLPLAVVGKNLGRYKANSITSIVKLLKMPRLFVSIGYDSFCTVLMGTT